MQVQQRVDLVSCLARNIIPLRKCAFANLSDRLYRVCIENPGNYCLIVPAAFSASILLCAPFLECGGSLVSRRRRRLLTAASLFGWMMLYDFHQNYLQPIWRTG